MRRPFSKRLSALASCWRSEEVEVAADDDQLLLEGGRPEAGPLAPIAGLGGAEGVHDLARQVERHRDGAVEDGGLLLADRDQGRLAERLQYRGRELNLGGERVGEARVSTEAGGRGQQTAARVAKPCLGHVEILLGLGDPSVAVGGQGERRGEI